MYEKILERVNRQSLDLALLRPAEKNRILRRISHNILSSKEKILRANRDDLKKAVKSGKPPAFMDRLTMNKQRIEEMASQINDITRLKMPPNEVLEKNRMPNGLLIKKIRVPIGVIFVIYESRPNVTSDCAAICLKAGNSVILRGGSDALNSNLSIYSCIKKALPEQIRDTVVFINDTAHSTVIKLLSMNRFINAVIPRGGENLINTVVTNSKIPVIYHGKGICHLYVHASADVKMARAVALNAKVQRPGVCNAIETLLVDRKISRSFLPLLYKDFKGENVEMRGCPQTRAVLKEILPAKKEDWDTEYLEKIISIKIVAGIEEAVDFINRHGSMHSEAIVAKSSAAASYFLSHVDAACVYHNTSTRFTDGGQFGMGAEIGISNQKLHARGPVGIKELTTYKYVISGRGQLRE